MVCAIEEKACGAMRCKRVMASRGISSPCPFAGQRLGLSITADNVVSPFGRQTEDVAPPLAIRLKNASRFVQPKWLYSKARIANCR